jgi:D-proline reductase (dithiol) PrdB
VSLVARHLEANGIPTLIIGSAIDIVEHARVPRYLHVDFPLGNPCGRPYDRAMQKEILGHALGWFTEASEKQWLARSPVEWSHDQSWRDDYSRVDDSNREALRQRGEARRRQQEQAKRSGAERSGMISET